MRLNASETHAEALKGGQDPKAVIAELRGMGYHFIAAVKTVSKGLDVPVDQATVLVRESKLWEGEFQFSEDPTEAFSDASAAPAAK